MSKLAGPFGSNTKESNPTREFTRMEINYTLAVLLTGFGRHYTLAALHGILHR